MKVLIVEDSLELADILRGYLQHNGYQCHILSSGEGAIQEILSGGWDLVLLDLMLPGVDGLTICREVRRSSEVPIIMMTAKAEEVDRLLGLKIGADDYVCKPYSPREVVARVEAVLRRSLGGGETKAGNHGLRLNEHNLTVACRENTIQLTLVEFRILQTLQQQPDRIFSRNELMDKAYTDNRIVSDRTIDSHIKKLRRKLESLGYETRVCSVYGAGYKLEVGGTGQVPRSDTTTA